MGVKGEHVIFDQSVTASLESGAPLHAEDQILRGPVPSIDSGIPELMAFDPGANRIETVGLGLGGFGALR